MVIKYAPARIAVLLLSLFAAMRLYMPTLPALRTEPRKRQWEMFGVTRSGRPLIQGAAFGQLNRGGFSNVLAIQLVLTPAAVNTIICAEQTFTCPGIPAVATASAIVVVNRTSALNGAIEVCHCRQSAVNQIGISWVNPTAGSVTPTAAQTYSVVAMW